MRVGKIFVVTEKAALTFLVLHSIVSLELLTPTTSISSLVLLSATQALCIAPSYFLRRTALFSASTASSCRPPLSASFGAAATALRCRYLRRHSANLGQLSVGKIICLCSARLCIPRASSFIAHRRLIRATLGSQLSATSPSKGGPSCSLEISSSVAATFRATTPPTSATTRKP